MVTIPQKDLREETIHYYTEILGEYAEYVRFEEADYSRNELAEIMVDAISPCLEENCGIFGCRLCCINAVCFVNLAINLPKTHITDIIKITNSICAAGSYSHHELDIAKPDTEKWVHIINRKY